MDLPQLSALLGNPLNRRQIFFSNLLLLGFDPVAAERRERIPFNMDMFALPNKKGFEIVFYFLFNKLNPVRCNELFRHCWPVFDKKAEALFRKTCNSWLTEIVKEDPNACLPRIIASLFMSPGGDKFYQLLLAFSRYVLCQLMGPEPGGKGRVLLQWPVLGRQGPEVGRVMASMRQCAIIQQRKRFLQQAECSARVQHQWKANTAELTRDFRTLNREIKDLERQVKAEVQRVAESKAARTSPFPKQSGFSNYDLDVQSIKRAEQVQKVRDMWHSLEGFVDTSRQPRGIVESLFEGTNKKGILNAADMNVRVPDLLLRQCEKEIQRRNVDNIYTGGKLNLLSLTHLWNLSLHLYIEKLHQDGLGEFVEHTPEVTTQLHTHQAHLANAQALRSRLSKEVLPNLKDSIHGLKDRLNREVDISSPDSIRSTSLGLGLLPPTPPVNFDTEDITDTRNELLNQHVKRVDAALAGVSTPEGASQMMEQVNRKVRQKQPSGLIQGSPLYAPRLANDGKLTATNCLPTSHIPKSKGVKDAKKPRTRMRSAPASAAQGKSATPGVKVTPSGTTLEVLAEQKSARGAMRSQRQAQDKEQVFKAPSSSVRKVRTRQKSAKRTPKHSGRSTSDGSTPQAHDILADKLVDRLLEATPKRYTPRKDCELPPPPQDEDLHTQLGQDAFRVRDRLARTPATGHAWSHHHASPGPLTSTRIETTSQSGSEYGGMQPGRDALAQRLFVDENSDIEQVDSFSHVKSSSRNSSVCSGSSDQNSTLRHSPGNSTLRHSTELGSSPEDTQVNAIVSEVIATQKVTPEHSAHGYYSGAHVHSKIQLGLSPGPSQAYNPSPQTNTPGALNTSLEELLRVNTTAYWELSEMPTPTLPSRTTSLRQSQGKRPQPKMLAVSQDSPVSRNTPLSAGTASQDHVLDLNPPQQRLGAYGEETSVDKENHPPGGQSEDSEEEDVDLLNSSARIIEIDNGNYSETIEVSPNKQKPKPVIVKEKIPTVQKSEKVDGSSSEPDIDSLMARFQRLKSGLLPSTTASSVSATPNNNAMAVTPPQDTGSQLLNSRYLERTPVKEPPKLFTLDLDEVFQSDSMPGSAVSRQRGSLSPGLLSSVGSTSLLQSPGLDEMEMPDVLMESPFHMPLASLAATAGLPTRAAAVGQASHCRVRPSTNTTSSVPFTMANTWSQNMASSMSREVHLDDFMDVDESILLPSSPLLPPGMEARNSPAVGKLVDL